MLLGGCGNRCEEIHRKILGNRRVLELENCCSTRKFGCEKSGTREHYYFLLKRTEDTGSELTLLPPPIVSTTIQ